VIEPQPTVQTGFICGSHVVFPTTPYFQLDLEGNNGSEPTFGKVRSVMPFIIKSVFLTLIVAMFGVTAIHMTTDAGAIHTAETSLILPDVSGAESFTQSGNSNSDSGERSSEVIQKLNEHLQTARMAVEAMPGYSATLEMQEEVDDELRSVDLIKLKTRREPFSVYMRWSDSEQEALYVHGENDNRIIVKPSKGLAAIRRVWRLQPDGRMAKQTSRYSITDVGIEKLVLRVQEFYREARNWSELAECECSEATLAGRKVTAFEVKFKVKANNPEYSGSKFCFDRESQLLVAVENFGWAGGSESRLIEHYIYSEIEVNPQPRDVDFSEVNPAYQFVKK
jgi:hypothetical protein